jgi:hypothetical protein
MDRRRGCGVTRARTHVQSNARPRKGAALAADAALPVRTHELFVLFKLRTKLFDERVFVREGGIFIRKGGVFVRKGGVFVRKGGIFVRKGGIFVRNHALPFGIGAFLAAFLADFFGVIQGLRLVVAGFGAQTLHLAEFRRDRYAAVCLYSLLHHWYLQFFNLL